MTVDEIEEQIEAISKQLQEHYAKVRLLQTERKELYRARTRLQWDVMEGDTVRDHRGRKVVIKELCPDSWGGNSPRVKGFLLQAPRPGKEERLLLKQLVTCYNWKKV